MINRATLSLTGLPPTLDEVDAFIADTRPDAFERLIERLLDSPRYGERMAAEWLDVARYSESDGFLDDLHDRFFWPWRDWVIEAFNENMPYHEFSRWQLAGDLLPHPTREQLLATAFGDWASAARRTASSTRNTVSSTWPSAASSWAAPFSGSTVRLRQMP